MKNRRETEEKILEAVGKIVLEKDFSALGVNAVALEAGVSKVLIYRYFGSFDGLLTTWAVRSHFWTGFEQTGHDFTGRSAADAKEIITDIFIRQIRIMRDNPLLRKLIRWHVSTDNPVSGEILAKVEEEGHKLSTNFMKRYSSSLDLEAMTAILVGGIYYLGIISDRADIFNAVPLKGPGSAERFEQAVRRMIEIMFTAITEEK